MDCGHPVKQDIYRNFMSLFVSTISGLIFGPRIKMRGSVLYSRSNLIGAFLTLFAFLKQVWVDPEADTIRSERRIFWFWKLSWQVDFDDIRNIKYQCRQIKTSWNKYYQQYNTIDRYVVGLNLNDGRYKNLWTFSDGDGFQAADSLEYVELLQFFTKKTLGPDHSRLRHNNQDFRPVWAKNKDAPKRRDKSAGAQAPRSDITIRWIPAFCKID